MIIRLITSKVSEFSRVPRALRIRRADIEFGEESTIGNGGCGNKVSGEFKNKIKHYGKILPITPIPVFQRDLDIEVEIRKKG